MRLRARWQALLCLAVLVVLGMYQAAQAGGQQAPRAPRRLVLIDRSGNQTLLGQVPGNANGPRVSPDGMLLAIGADGLLVGPLSDPAALRRIGTGRFPYWSTDGTRLFFEAPDAEILLWRRADGSDEPEQLVTPARAPESRSPDGNVLSFVKSEARLFSVLTLDLTTRRTTLLPNSGPEALGSNISPDGRWIAYQSTSSGRYEVYVQPLGRQETPVQVTTQGAFRPFWSADGSEIFFDDGNRRLFVVPVRTKPTFSTGVPIPLPITGFLQGGVGRRQYDLLPDGRFVMMFP